MMVERLHCRFMLLSSARLVIPGTEVEIRPVERSFAAMVEKENERCFVCVEDQVAREMRVLLLFDGNWNDFEGVVGC